MPDNNVILRKPRSGDKAIPRGLPRRFSPFFWGLLRRTKVLLAMTPFSIYILHFTFYILLSGCYSFTGASLPAGIKTIAIPLVTDNSNFSQANIRQDLTDQLVQKFTRDGSLQVRDRTVADALLDVTIT